MYIVTVTVTITVNKAAVMWQSVNHAADFKVKS